MNPRLSVVPGEGDDPALDVLRSLAKDFEEFKRDVPKPPPSDHVSIPRWIAGAVFVSLLSALVTMISVVFVTNKALNALETLHGAEQRSNEMRFLRNENEIRDIRGEVRALQQRGGNP